MNELDIEHHLRAVLDLIALAERSERWALLENLRTTSDRKVREAKQRLLWQMAEEGLSQERARDVLGISRSTVEIWMNDEARRRKRSVPRHKPGPKLGSHNRPRNVPDPDAEPGSGMPTMTSEALSR